jgi:hypothetical protein
MIDAGELHRHFRVLDTNTGREVWLLGGDTRYAQAGPELWHYRTDPEGEYILVELSLSARRGYVLKPSEAEALPGGEYHPDHLSGLLKLQLERSYEGSWRQYADRECAQS